jgi:large subunit ribosomal protein L24
MPGVDIRKDDTVRVMAGKDRGKEGRVVRVDPHGGKDGRGRVMVDGVAMVKKSVRTQGRRSSSGQQLQQGGIIDAEMFIDISNVQLVCRSCGKPTRIGHRVADDGTKTRICRKCEAEQ